MLVQRFVSDLVRNLCSVLAREIRRTLTSVDANLLLVKIITHQMSIQRNLNGSPVEYVFKKVASGFTLQWTEMYAAGLGLDFAL